MIDVTPENETARHRGASAQGASPAPEQPKAIAAARRPEPRKPAAAVAPTKSAHAGMLALAAGGAQVDDDEWRQF